jgi:hypothetical protein
VQSYSGGDPEKTIPLNNEQVAARLDEVAELLEAQGQTSSGSALAISVW